MPITVTPTTPAGIFTPGGIIAWHSDFTGPLTTGASYTVTVLSDSAEGAAVWSSGQSANQSKFGQMQLLGNRNGTQSDTQGPWPVDGSNVRVIVELIENGNTIDSGATVSPWSDSAGIGAQISDREQQGTGGLTPIESQQLLQTQQSTWPQHLVDTLTLFPLTAGPVHGPIAANLTSPVFGIIVRIATFPEQLQPNTPDGDYWYPSLAVVRVFRGSDTWMRVPIHTSSKLINLWVEGLMLGLADAVLSAGWLLNLSVQVWFREGVTGEVFLMRVP